MATQRLYDKFHEFPIPPHSNPIAALHDLENINNQIYENAIGRIAHTVLYERFVLALPDEYSPLKGNSAVHEKQRSGRDHPHGKHAFL